RRPGRLRPPGHRLSANARADAQALNGLQRFHRSATPARRSLMFTGIVTDIGEVIAVRPRAEGLHRLEIACRYERASIVEGASIACSGVCLTVVGAGEAG